MTHCFHTNSITAKAAAGRYLVLGVSSMNKQMRRLRRAITMNLIERCSKYHPQKMTVITFGDSETMIGLIGVSIN
jgi:hypothetical protein